MADATKRKYKLFIFVPSYGGNGGISSMHPDVARWLVKLTAKLKEDPRIESFFLDTTADTPITMTRNAAVLKARHLGCDLLLMCDSDQSPDMYEGQPWYKPFWDAAFEEIDNHYEKGPLVIGAPYCGPPGSGENCYVFYFENYGDRGDETSLKLEMYSRHQASLMRGIQECAALPTGMILFDMRIFKVLEPSGLSVEDVLLKFSTGEMTLERARREITQGWFYYEWKNGYAAEKASTEDVTATRDMALAGSLVLGYNPVRCAWDSWVGHHKPWCVGKPVTYTTSQISDMMARVILEDRDARESVGYVNFPVDGTTA